MNPNPSATANADGTPVVPIRKLNSPEEWAWFYDMRSHALLEDYVSWKHWARGVSFAMAAKVSKQVGLQTPGNPNRGFSPLFYHRLRASDENGVILHRK